MSISKRFEKLKTHEGSQTKLADKTGLTVALISRIINAGDQATVRSDTLEAIARAYPNLNTRWLLTGEGLMWLQEDQEGVSYAQDLSAEYDNFRKRQEEQTELVKRVNTLLEQRVSILEREILDRDPELARKLGLK